MSQLVTDSFLVYLATGLSYFTHTIVSSLLFYVQEK